MQTNRDWLNNLASTDVSALNAWMDAEHVEDANGTLDALSDGLDAKSGDCTDSREKLEADVRKLYSYSTSTLLYPPSANKTTDYIRSVSVDTVLGWLDRQAAITRADDEDICDTCEWPSLAEYDQEAHDRIAELQADNAVLLDANARLQRSLAEASEECEAYREKFGEALDYAAAILNLEL